jgi:hypothetical protein
MRLEKLVIFVHEINGGGRVYVPPEKASHFGNVVQWHAHSDLPLRGEKIDPGNDLRHGMFDLEEGMIQEFDRTGPDVLDRLRQAQGGPLHFVERIRLGSAGWPFFENLLQAALGGIIVAVEHHGVAAFVADKLLFHVARVLLAQFTRPQRNPGREMFAPLMDRVGGQRTPPVPQPPRRSKSQTILR